MTKAAETDTAPLDDDDDGAPLPLATWLRLSARRLKRDPDERAEILAEEEIEPKQWSLADRYWNLLIAERISEGDHSLSDRYADACVRELDARKQAAPAAQVAAPEAAPPEPALLPPAAPLPAMSAPAGDLKPSFLLREEPPALQMAPAHVKKPLDMGTAIGAIPGVPALPFAPSAPGGGASSHATQAAFEPRPASAPREPIGETEAVDVGALARRVLAFGPPKPAEAETPQQAPARQAGPAQQPRQAAPAVPTLTVEQYASLCVDLELAPQSTAEVLRRYGVTQDAKRTLDEGWSRVFAEQPARRAAFEHAKVTYRAWLARGGR